MRPVVVHPRRSSHVNTAHLYNIYPAFFSETILGAFFPRARKNERLVSFFCPVPRSSRSLNAMSLLTYNPSTGIYKPKTTPVYIPDDLSIYDFVFSYHPPRAQTNYDVPAPTRRSTREARASKPWLVDALTGRSLTAAEVESRTCAIAKFMYGGVGLRTDDAVAVFSGNEIDFATSVWAAFRIGSIVTAYVLPRVFLEFE